MLDEKLATAVTHRLIVLYRVGGAVFHANEAAEAAFCVIRLELPLLLTFRTLEM